MKLADFAGVFSRQFVVGFFIPAFFGLAAASLLVTSELLPNSFERYPAAATRLLILGGLAIPLGIALQGFHAALLRGVTQQPSGADFYRFLPMWLFRLLMKPEKRAFTKLTHLRDDEQAPFFPRIQELASRLARELKRVTRARPERPLPQQAAAELDRIADNALNSVRDAGELLARKRNARTTAAFRLEERYPEKIEDLLATRLGNTLRATQEYVYSRWGFDTWAVWPRIQSLLSEQERELVSDSEAEVAFFLNSALAAFLVGVLLVTDGIWHQPLPAAAAPVYAIPFLATYALYRLSIGAAVRWGAYQRATLDLHRLELIEKMGFDKPRTLVEQYALARALNRFILYRPPTVRATEEAGGELLAFVRSVRSGERTPVNPNELERLGWQARSNADQHWLDTDCALYGKAFATKAGVRVDPREVIVGSDGIPRRGGDSSPSKRSRGGREERKV